MAQVAPPRSRCYSAIVPEDLRTADPTGLLPSAPRVLRLTVEYDGAQFAGWQIQPDARTVQGELERALAVVLREQVRAQGASRTDAGVHALGQVASVETTSTVGCDRLRGGLDALLPEDVGVLEVAEAPPGWSARFAARGKHYRYRVLDRRAKSPAEARTSWHVTGGLDVDAMQAAAAHLVGTHDFTTFATKADLDVGRPTVRTLHAVRVARQPAGAWGDVPGAPRPIVAIDVFGDHFLHKMVRTIAGTLVQVGRGRRAPGSIPAALAARDRRAAGQAAPPQGLFLMRVFYEDAPLEAAGASPAAFDHPLDPSSTEGVSREGHDHRSTHERPRHDPDVRGGEGRQARSLLRSAP